MGRKKKIANKDKHAYELLSGERVSIGWLSEADLKWLEQLKEDVEKGADYFILLKRVRGVSARPLKGSDKLTQEVAQSALFRVASDIVERAGIRQGFSLPMGSGLETPDEKPLVSASEAAEMIGISRAGVHLALTRGKLRGWKVGKMWVVDCNSASSYRNNRLGSTA